MAAKIPPSVLPDISPSRGEISCGTDFLSQLASPRSAMKCRSRHLSISPLEGEMPGRAEGGKRRTPRGQTHAR